MTQLPVAWRLGLALAVVALAVIALARPSSLRRGGRRIAVAVARVAAALSGVLLLAEHTVTRRRRARRRAPIGWMVRAASRVEANGLGASQRLLARVAPVPKIKRGVAIAVVAAALAPSAAWVAMHQWPTSHVGRGALVAFTRWSSIESTLHLARGHAPVVPVPASVAPIVESSTVTRLAWTLTGVAEPRLFGEVGDIAAPADFNGDGVAELAVFRPSTGEWIVDGGGPALELGIEGDVPVPADYDGDGRAEPAVFRPSRGEWLIAGQPDPLALGADGDVPVPGDYDGAGRAVPMLFRPATGEWLRVGVEPVVFGQAADIAVPGPYVVAGRMTIAVFRPSTNEWLISGSPPNPQPQVFGEEGDIPMVTDLDGDGRTEPTVFRPLYGDVIVHGRPVIETGSTGSVPVVLADRHGTRLAIVAAA
jgi:hypothetical protein